MNESVIFLALFRMLLGCFIFLNVMWGFLYLHKYIERNQKEKMNLLLDIEEFDGLMKLVWGLIFFVIGLIVIAKMAYWVGSLII